MRHFEEFEIEHLFNGTGSWLLRLRCRFHLKHCELCRQRRERLLEEKQLIDRIREAVKRMESFSSDRKEAAVPEKNQ